MQDCKQLYEGMQSAINKQQIYYYSNYQLFDPSIISDLLFVKWMKCQSMKLFDEKWNQTSSRAVFIVKNNERCNLSPTFINDAFLYSWIILTDQLSFLDITLAQKVDVLQEFKQIFKHKLYSFQQGRNNFLQYFKDNDNVQYLLNSFFEFYFESTINIIKQLSNNPKFALFNDLKQILQYQIIISQLQPLAVLNGYTEQEETNNSPYKRRRFTSSGDENELCIGINSLNIQDEAQELSSIKQRASSFQQNALKKMKKITKQQQKFFKQYAIDMKQPSTTNLLNCQIVNQMVVQVWQQSLEANMNKQLIRCIQPSKKFYKLILQLWLLEQVNNKKKALNFNQLIFKSKHFFSKEWTDRFILPIYNVYQTLDKILSSTSDQSVNPGKFLSTLLQGFTEKMNLQWDENIVSKSGKLHNDFILQ